MVKLSRTSLCLPDFCFSTTGAATGAEAGEAVLTAFAAEARAAGGRAALEAAGERRGILAAISGSFVEMEIPFIRYGIRLALGFGPRPALRWRLRGASARDPMMSPALVLALAIRPVQ